MASIPLGLYLWKRIKEIGVSTIMGVPGDFNLEILDYIFQVEGLNWVSSANELNAAYAADGYARVKGTPGVFVTTHGVGEMSAINGVAGSYSEQIKTIHVVGQTTRAMQKQRMLIHHSIDNDPDHQVYSKMSEGARVASAILMDPKTAPGEIDRVIRECFIQSRPVYIFMPLDMCWEQIPANLLDAPIDISLPVDISAQDTAVSAIIEELSKAQSPCLFIDGLVQRHGAGKETRQLAEKLNIPVYCANMSKAIIDETAEYHVGLYNGMISAPGVTDAFHTHDLVLVFGSIPADTNTGGFTRKIDPQKSIDVRPFDVIIKGKTYPKTFIKPLTAALVASEPKCATQPDIPLLPGIVTPQNSPTDRLVQSHVWHQLTKFLRPNDVVIAETGTPTFGLSDCAFPAQIRWLTQTYYGSIGWATPAALGAELALHELAAEQGEPRGRTILVTGDGSFGLTMQEMGTMITYRDRVKPVVFMINNSGYTIERVIHGARQPYNDVNNLAFKHILPLFQHPSPDEHYALAKDPAELEKVITSKVFMEPSVLALCEIVLDKLDVPWRLSAQIALRGKAAVEYLYEEGFSGWEKKDEVPEEWVDGKSLIGNESGSYWGEVQNQGKKG
ncbi:pyruvate decarboxylase [Pseudovirgaria hyperparasitica]|uniref:Pyruvate decarboxylase n=1 Tax=Pseudovirgaria hyperparasitica TaxID=470096 RepID=A0A6A6W577_9PEZI|nr:pyruvate decarboxylase [Pseudovirgaria hyperparasitica]KAF2758032.1 pyruvate decarboxylase [Pseudovirgaria hyperparasitica]